MRVVAIFFAAAMAACAQGIITTVAGNGTAGDTGDGGPAASAEIIISGQGMTPDTQGNLYINQNGTNIPGFHLCGR